MGVTERSPIRYFFALGRKTTSKSRRAETRSISRFTRMHRRGTGGRAPICSRPRMPPACRQTPPVKVTLRRLAFSAKSITVVSQPDRTSLSASRYTLRLFRLVAINAARGTPGEFEVCELFQFRELSPHEGRSAF